MESTRRLSKKFLANLGGICLVIGALTLLPYDAIGADEVSAVPFQTASLTQMETRRTARSRFWIEPDSMEVDYSQDFERFHALLMAGQTSPEIFDQVLQGGADSSLWLTRGCQEALGPEEDLSSSALSVSTPLHAAIAVDNVTKVKAILDRGFGPNALSFITGSHALTQAQYAIIVGNIEAYQVLESHPDFDPTIVTPVFGAHSLHFAAAQLREDLLDMIGLSLSSAPVTAIGHTLLHIACLPLDEIIIGSSGPKAKASYHDTRWPGATQYRCRKVWPTTWGPSGQEDFFDGAEVDKNPRDLDGTASGERFSQLAVCKLLVAQLGVNTIAQCDMHGNTALHYLAGVKDVNHELIDRLRAQHGANTIWEGSRNHWGCTPTEFLQDRLANAGRGFMIRF